MRLFGIIGYPLNHTLSPEYFIEKFKQENIYDAVYKAFPLESLEEFNLLISNNTDLVGLNITIPYKEKIIPFLDKLEENAREIGSVNTIRIDREKKHVHLTGFNTDVYGFRDSIKPWLKNDHKKALVLGTGGVSKSVTWVLKQLSIDYTMVSRNPKKSNNIP